MELILRPWGPDIWPVAYTDLHSGVSFDTSPGDRGGSAPSADLRITMHTPSSVSSWAGAVGATHIYLAASTH